jgi:hypothetical protein
MTFSDEIDLLRWPNERRTFFVGMYATYPDGVTWKARNGARVGHKR